MDAVTAVVAAGAVLVGGFIGWLSAVLVYGGRVRACSAGLRSQTRRLDFTMQLVLLIARNADIPQERVDELFRLMTEGLRNDGAKAASLWSSGERW